MQAVFPLLVWTRPAKKCCGEARRGCLCTNFANPNASRGRYRDGKTRLWRCLAQHESNPTTPVLQVCNRLSRVTGATQGGADAFARIRTEQLSSIFTQFSIGIRAKCPC